MSVDRRARRGSRRFRQRHGPRWFFEGLALACAGQCQASAPGSLFFAEVSALITEDERRPLGYPRYADMFRSVAKLAPVKELVARAGTVDFLELLRSRDANRTSDPPG